MNQHEDGRTPNLPSPEPINPPHRPAGADHESAPGVPSPKTDPAAYDFIIQTDHTPKKSSFGGSLAMRIVLILLGLVLLIAAMVIIRSLLTPKDTATTLATTLALEQQEIIRVSNLASQSATSQDIKDAAVTISTSVANDQTGTNAYLARNNIEINEKQLAAARDTKTDQLLADARASSTFDTTWKDTMTTQLSKYQNDVRALYAKTQNPAFRETLKKAFDNSKLLLDMLSASLAR